ncbi:MAG: hypothetical protein K6F58_00520 [Bacteroidales bacterium]|nr:hypothetical protein [Bacteroidales bacterium]
MLRKLLFCSIFAFLCTSFSLTAVGAEPGNGGQQSLLPAELSAALCEMVAWEANDKATRDSLLLARAQFLSEAGESGRAYETVCRISRFGLDADRRAELLRRKLMYTWEAGMMDDFRGFLEEASVNSPSGSPRHRSEDLAMILSVIPGAGLAYAGDWTGAGKAFLAGGTTIALGVGAFLSGLYVTAFLGGGMLLYTILPPSTDKAVKTAAEFNSRRLKEFYTPIYDSIR